MSLTVAVLIFAAAIAAVAIGKVISRRRSQVMADWANAHGWHYVDHDARYAQLSMGYPYSTGYNHSTHDVVTGTWNGHPAACFTYHYDMNHTAQAGQSLHSRYFSVWLLGLPASLPSMQVRRESLISSIVLPSGMAVVDVGHDLFGRTFKVFSDDADFAHRALTTQMTQFLLDSGHGGFDICDAGIVATRDGVMTTATVTAELDYLTAVIAHLPSAV